MFVETKFFHKAGEGSGGGGGGGGSDPHNLGYYADLTALQTAHPTGTNGDFAILGSTDTIWVWDSGTSAWKDTDTKGQVTSVNNQTGAVTLTASDVGALPSNTHIPADPVQADWGEADSAALDYIKNKPTLGTAASANTTDFATAAQGAKADTAVQPGDLATVATTGAYSDLTGTPTIPAAQVNSDWNASSGVAEILNKPSLATVATSGSYTDLTNTPSIPAAQVNSDWNASSGVAEILNKPTLAAVATSGAYADLSGTPSIPTKASDVNAVPQLSTLPTAGVDYLGQVVQFVGTTGTYTNGYFYECVSDGGNPATYSWSAVQTQAASAPVVPATAPTLVVADWSSNTQTITVSGVTASNVVLVGPAPLSAQDYADAGILCTAQGTNSLTFTCATVPSNAITLSVVIFG